MICSDISPIQGVYSSGHAAIVCVPGFVTCVCTYVHTAQLTFFACLCRIHCSVLLQPLEYSTTEANGSCFSCQTQPSHLHVRIRVYIDIRKRHLICARQSYWMPLAVTIATNQEKMPAKKQAQLQVSYHRHCFEWSSSLCSTSHVCTCVDWSVHRRRMG